MNKVRQHYKVLFISINNVWRYGNIGMDQLLGYLRNKEFNIDIKYFSNKLNVNTIVDEIGLEYDFYGFSVNSSNYSKCCELAEIIKKHNQEAIIDFGGGYPTRYYREIVKENRCVDYMVLGDGEIPTEYLLDNLSKNKVLHENNKIKHESIVTRYDIEGKKDYFNQIVDWNPAYDYYLGDTVMRNSRKVHCIQTKNNICTGNCSFCNERHGKVTYKDIDSIIEQIEYVHINFGVKKIYFTDDNILDPNNDVAKERMFELCNKLKKRKLKLAYQCYFKAISVDDTPRDNEMLKLMRQVGFVEIFVGIEAGNQEDLDLYNKFTKVEDNYKIIQLIKRHGIFPIIGYISFNPYSTKKTIADNFRYLCDIECTYLHNYLYSFVVVNKYTSLYEKIKEDGLLIDDREAYLDVNYTYKNSEVVEVLDYVKYDMLPKLARIEYELDWITYSMLEHQIWYKNLKDYSKQLYKQRKEDIEVIRKYLGILFFEFDVEKFKLVETEFWNHFYNEEAMLKEIYDYYISLHNVTDTQSYE